MGTGSGRTLTQGCRLAACVLVLGACLAAPAAAQAPPGPERVNNILDRTADILWEMSDFYFHKGDHLQTIRLGHLVEQIQPQNDQPYSDIAWLEWSAGDSEDAVADLKRGVAANPDEYDLYADMGECYYLWLKRADEAMPYYIQATSYYDTAQWRVFSVMAHCAEKLGDYSRAALTWRIALLKAGDNEQEIGPSQNNLRRVMTELAQVEGKQETGG